MYFHRKVPPPLPNPGPTIVWLPVTPFIRFWLGLIKDPNWFRVLVHSLKARLSLTWSSLNFQKSSNKRITTQFVNLTMYIKKKIKILKINSWLIQLKLSLMTHLTSIAWINIRNFFAVMCKNFFAVMMIMGLNKCDCCLT